MQAVAQQGDYCELWNRSPFALQSSPAACTAGAHEGRAQCAKQAVVSPMKQGVPQASLRAQWNDHAELRGAGDRNTPRRKIPFSRAKIASLQFPRPKIHRILAETGRGGSGCEKTFGFFTATLFLSPKGGRLAAWKRFGRFCVRQAAISTGSHAALGTFWGALAKKMVDQSGAACDNRAAEPGGRL